MGFDLDDIKRRLLIKYPQFGSILANLKIVEDYTCIDYNGNETMSTDADAIYYHPDFINSINVNQQVALFAHEIGHVALDHIYRSEGRDPETWNIAADAVINANLRYDGLELVDGMIEIDGAFNYDVETLYNKLIQDKKDGKQNEKYNQPGNHSRWKDAIDKKNQSCDNSNDNKFVEEQNNKIPNEKDIFQKNRELRRKLLKDLQKDIVAKSQTGSSEASNNINISNIGGSQKLINWRVLLRNVCKVDMDWSYKNATLEYGIVTPHLEDVSMPLTEILLDTSGSINEELLRNFLKECKSILKQSRVKVGCFDTKFYGFTEIRKESDIDKLPLVGGGGTDFDICVNSFSRHAENKIIFTDGCAKMPKKKDNIIWIVFGGEKISPPGGKVIYIDKKDLQVVREINMDSESLKRR